MRTHRPTCDSMSIEEATISNMWEIAAIVEVLERKGLALVLVLGMTLGCAMVEVVGPEHLHNQQFVGETKPVAHIYADNWGWYLFKHIPIVTGNLDKPGIPRLPVFFTDNVRVDLLVDKVTKESTKLGASIISDLRTRDRSYYAVWTLFFWLNG